MSLPVILRSECPVWHSTTLFDFKRTLAEPHQKPFTLPIVERAQVYSKPVFHFSNQHQEQDQTAQCSRLLLK